MEPIVLHLTELCRELTPVQFRLAMDPLLRCLLSFGGVESPEWAANCLADVFSQLDLDPCVGSLRPTSYERRLGDALWRSDIVMLRTLLNHQDQLVFELTETDLTHLKKLFWRARQMFEGFGIANPTQRWH